MPRPSLTEQLQQAWLQTQMPKASKPSTNAVAFQSPEAAASFGSNGALKKQTSSLRQSPAVSDDTVDSLPKGPVLWGPLPASPDNFSEPLSSPLSRGNSVEAWDSGQEHEVAKQDPTQAYITDLLNDKNMCKQKCMLYDCTAYQAMHNELADLIGDVESRLEFSDNPMTGGKCPSLDVGTWMDSLLDASPPKNDDFMLADLPPGSVRGDVASSLRVPDFDGSELALEFPELPNFNGYTEAQFSPLPSFSGSDATSPGPGFSRLPSFGSANVEHSLEPGFISNGQVGPELRFVKEPESLEEVIRLLLECAQAVNADDVAKADMLVGNLRQISSPHGSTLQRVTHYFLEGLVAKLSGTGADLFTALSKTGPSAADVLRAYQLYTSNVPHTKMAHFFANSHLLEAFEGAQKVHVIDYGILYGYQWPSFMQALATRPGGPPKLVRITGIEFPQPGLTPDQRVKETGRKLAQVAEGLGLPFEYKAIADKWENIQVTSVNLRRDEALAVSCIFRLRHLLDESVLPSSPRKTVLERIRSMNPRVFITGVANMAGNVPFYMTRLREAITNYHAHFDALDATVPRDNLDRQIIEREVMGREILNIVSCDGVQRIERPEPYGQWQRRLVQAGFQQLALKESLFSGTREMLRDFHPSFGIGQDEDWLLMGWKDTVLQGLAAWKPK